MGSSGQKATARVTLSDSGSVVSVVVSASDPDMKASVEAAYVLLHLIQCLQIRMHAVKHEVLLQPYSSLMKTAIIKKSVMAVFELNLQLKQIK